MMRINISSGARKGLTESLKACGEIPTASSQTELDRKITLDDIKGALALELN